MEKYIFLFIAGIIVMSVIIAARVAISDRTDQIDKLKSDLNQAQQENISLKKQISDLLDKVPVRGKGGKFIKKIA